MDPISVLALAAHCGEIKWNLAKLCRNYVHWLMQGVFTEVVSATETAYHEFKRLE
jgi:hypothetical protein